MAGKLTTHVLDLSIGKPAANVKMELCLVKANHELVFLEEKYTNKDGRVNEPFLEGESMKLGIYQLHFHVGTYFQSQVTLGEDPRFLDCVPVRFIISNPESHYHVPLLISPGGYSTYRGS